ncbi:hypothetical protein [Dyadobacter frigoris]|uniref:Uncharacterized protein n=1 Tax=Dyadobacter frigoris TaxID=2576211 RepID=A0A4U6D7E9_9BACT|nr:hypothetical protein [Dyadobacter frigoris]TKT93312.1 hypothetical protein FDK13_05525 [Dyadobacter frigoris]
MMDCILHENNYIQSLGWEWEILRKIEFASMQTGIEAWGATGLFYRPFFNGRYGPAQDGFDKDVCVRTEQEVRIFWTFLKDIWPDIRWSVYSGEIENNNYHVPNNHWAVQMGRPLLFRLGAVNIHNGKVHVLMPYEALVSLNSGLIEINHQAFINDGSQEDMKNVAISAVTRTRKVLSEYPGLKCGSTVNEIAEKFQVDKVASYDVKDLFYLNAQVGKSSKKLNLFLEDTQEGLVLIERIKTNLKSGSYPSPRFEELPKALESIRKIKIKQEHYLEITNLEETVLKQSDEIVAPDQYPSWLEYCAKNEFDASFKEWFSIQLRSRNPVGGKDPYLSKFISGYLFSDEFDINTNGVHQSGWSWKKYIREKIFALNIDLLVVDKKEVRSLVRLATIFFDIDTVSGLKNQGREELTVSIWKASYPEWLSENEVFIVTELIRGQYQLMGLLGEALRKINLAQGNTILNTYDGSISNMLKVKSRLLRLEVWREQEIFNLLLASCRAHLYATNSLQFLSVFVDEIFSLIFPLD